MAINKPELAIRFPKVEDSARHYLAKNEITALAHELAELINDHVPGSREESEAITAVEVAVMWAHAALDRRSRR
ncbi:MULTISPECIES: hypothetical protein [unclassified Streptomyces]|uniref:Acb2/Tad1 domain-containing protein n=1 Tax=Streptomyces TaxID=1883 RepID=UPI0033166F20